MKKNSKMQITLDCVAEYLSLRREDYYKQYESNENIVNHLQADLIYHVAMAMKKGFFRNSKHYYPKDIVFVKFMESNIVKNIMNSGYYWYCSNGEILSIKDEDIFQ